MSEPTKLADRREPPAGHVLLVYASEAQRSAALTSWMITGLRRGEKVICTGMTQSAFDTLVWGLGDVHGFDVDLILRSGQLRLATLQDFYPPTGQESFVASSLAEGYDAVRITGPADQALTVMTAAECVEIEARLDALCERYPLSALGQYDSRLARDNLPGAVTPHSIVADEIATLTKAGMTAPAGAPSHPQVGVTLDGELDSSNTDLLREVVGHAALLVPDAGALTLDVTRLEFMGVLQVRALMDSTWELRSRGGTVDIRGPNSAVTAILLLLHVHRMPGVRIRHMNG